jgi:hypothetical protein
MRRVSDAGVGYLFEFKMVIELRGLVRSGKPAGGGDAFV